MCDRRERMKVGVVLVVAAMMIGGMSPPVAAQSGTVTKDLNQEIFQKLQNSGALDQLATKLGVSKEQITGVDFMGELRIEAFSLGAPYNVDLEQVNVQEMSAKNCGTVEDTVHLTVTNSKETTHEVSYQHTWGTEIGYSITWGTGVSVEAFGASFESNFEQNFSLAANYAYTRGGADSTTISTSWEQGIDVLVPPHQIVPVTFIAKKETADRDFTQVFTAYGKAEVQLADPTRNLNFGWWISKITMTRQTMNISPTLRQLS